MPSTGLWGEYNGGIPAINVGRKELSSGYNSNTKIYLLFSAFLPYKRKRRCSLTIFLLLAIIGVVQYLAYSPLLEQISIYNSSSKDVVFSITETMNPPIYFYYQLNDFYHSSRRFMMSRPGKMFGMPYSCKLCRTVGDSCKLRPNVKLGQHQCTTEDEDRHLMPCGISSTFIFDDKYELYVTQNKTLIEDKIDRQKDNDDINEDDNINPFPDTSASSRMRLTKYVNRPHSLSYGPGAINIPISDSMTASDKSDELLGHVMCSHFDNHNRGVSHGHVKGSDVSLHKVDVVSGRDVLLWNGELQWASKLTKWLVTNSHEQDPQLEVYTSEPEHADHMSQPKYVDRLGQPDPPLQPKYVDRLGQPDPPLQPKQLGFGDVLYWLPAGDISLWLSWLRPSVSSQFRKLIGRIDVPLYANSSLLVKILENNFRSEDFRSIKSVVISQSSFLGSRNDFSVYISITTAAFFFVLSLFPL